MRPLGTTLSKLAMDRQAIKEAIAKVAGKAAGTMAPFAGGTAAPTRLTRVMDFGSNPGDLAMLTYVPAALSPDPALVVVLHGCGQTAAGYDHGAGWSDLADRHGFVLVYPEQSRANNPQGCFNWFQPGDIARGSGEALSIRQMVGHAVERHGIDHGRIFVTGLSAGGAMAAVMLATYPEIFAGGAVIAGLPYGVASNVQEALAAMSRIRARPSREWGDMVRAASRHRGPWPTLSVWHGDADTVVGIANATELARQWSDLHGLAERPTRRDRIGDEGREVWCDGAGREVVELVTVAGMGHGTPLAVGTGEMQGGAAAPFMLDVGISSSHHIARFWGLSDDRPAKASGEIEANRAAPQAAAPENRRENPQRGAPASSAPLDGEVIAPSRKADAPADEPAFIGSILGSDQIPQEARAVIRKAFKAAGLIKS